LILRFFLINSLIIFGNTESMKFSLLTTLKSYPVKADNIIKIIV